MYLLSMESILELVRFLKSNPKWLRILDLKRSIKGRGWLQISISDLDRFACGELIRRAYPYGTIA